MFDSNKKVNIILSPWLFTLPPMKILLFFAATSNPSPPPDIYDFRVLGIYSNSKLDVYTAFKNKVLFGVVEVYRFPVPVILLYVLSDMTKGL